MAKPKKKPAKRPPEDNDRLKRERLAAFEQETKRKRLASAGLDYDPRTAQGKRNFDVASLGPSMRVSLNHFNNCFKRKCDRTNRRILAWSFFDEHCHKLHAGEIAPPKYEAGVDGGKILGVSESRLDALRADKTLRSWLGRVMHNLLTRVIYHQRNYKELEAEGFGPEKLVSLMFKQALDEAAAYWSVGDDNRFGSEVNRLIRSEQPG